MNNKEKEFLKDVYYNLIQTHTAFQNEKNFKGVTIMRHAEKDLDLETIKNGCKDLGIKIENASEDKYYCKKLNATKDNETWLFSFSEAFNNIMI